MGIHHYRRRRAILIQKVEWSDSLMNFLANLGARFFYAGILGLVLAIIFSEYTSLFMYAKYQGWSGWRTITGSEPNSLTSILQKVSWAAFFSSCWFMLWKFDSFFSFSKHPEKVKVTEHPSNEENKKNSDPAPSSEENNEDDVQDEKEEEKITDIQDSGVTEQNTEPKEEKPVFTFVDIKYADVIGLKAPFTLDEIKPSYRKLIAQYHPDRVAAMGEEIREVAEKKAKEINRAYDYFQKKFDLS